MDELGKFYLNKIFEIPLQQRPYSWTNEQVKAILTDLYLALRRDEEHYCGPVFLESSKDVDNNPKYTTGGKPENLAHYNILDGQQRITTIILIAAALSKDKEIIEGKINPDEKIRQESLMVQGKLQDLFSYMGSRDGPLDTSRLIFNDPDMDLMINHLLFENPGIINHNQITKASMRKLKNNFDYVKNEINDICKTEGDLRKKIKICNKFLDGLKIEMIDMGVNYFNKYTVFEAINNRGLVLSEFDKIKNLSLHIADQHEKRCEEREIPATITKDLIQTNWYNTLKHLYDYELEKDETRCITDLWRIKNNQGMMQENTTFFEFKKKFQSLVDTDNVNLMNELVINCNNWSPYTEAYCKIYTKKMGEEFSLANMTQKSTINLDRILNKIALPDEFRLPLTSAFLRYDQGDFEKFSEFMEKALLRMHGLKTHRSISRGRAQLTKLSQEIFSLNEPIEYSLSEICKIVNELAPLKDLVDYLISGKSAYNNWRGNTLYYFLYRIDLDLSPGSNVGYENNKAARQEQIEHILPQTHRPHWSESWPNEDTANAWMHRIGNLTLTENNISNTHLLNYNISTKCTSGQGYNYSNGRHIERNISEIATSYSDNERWNKLEIITNEILYSHYLIKLWGLPFLDDLKDFSISNEQIKKIDSYYEDLIDDSEIEIKLQFDEDEDAKDLDYFTQEYKKNNFGEGTKIKSKLNELLDQFKPVEICNFSVTDFVNYNLQSLDEEE
jgi:hypothetical protein